MSSHLKGPAAVTKQMIDARVELKKALRHATTAAERKLIQDQIVLVNIVLRDLRRKRTRPKMYREVDDLTDRMRVMARLAKAMGRGRNVIYHGTRALPAVMRTGKLIPPESGECAVFFSRSAEIAAYFACLRGAKEERRVPGLLVLDRASLRQCYSLEPNRYDPSRDRNEREEAVLAPYHQLSQASDWDRQRPGRERRLRATQKALPASGIRELADSEAA
jgi:hypothetical protein